MKRRPQRQYETSTEMSVSEMGWPMRVTRTVRARRVTQSECMKVVARRPGVR